MNPEYRRQLVHLSGILFVLLVQAVPQPVAVATFAIIALLFFVYAELIAREESRILRLFRFFEPELRKFALTFERRNSRPFLGATLFYLAAAICFALFPLPVASAAIAILAIGDGVATLVGVRFGIHKIFGRKSVEGSLAFILTAAAAASFFVPPMLALAGALAGALAELALGHPTLQPFQNRGLDDNLFIPLAAAALIHVLAPLAL